MLLVSDTSMVSAETPSLTTGLRGLAYWEIEVTGPNRDLHSGHFGGAVANPINVLSKLMADITDADGKVIGRKEADDIDNGYFIDHALDEVWGYKYEGVRQENEAEEAAKYSQIPGDPKILDVDQNYKYNNDD